MATLVTTVNSFRLLSMADGKVLATNAELGTSPIFGNWIHKEPGQIWTLPSKNAFRPLCNELNVCLAVDKNTPEPGTRVIQRLKIQEPGQRWKTIFKDKSSTTFEFNYVRYHGLHGYIQNEFGLCLTRTDLQYATLTQENCNPDSNPNQMFLFAVYYY